MYDDEGPDGDSDDEEGEVTSGKKKNDETISAAAECKDAGTSAADPHPTASASSSSSAATAVPVVRTLETVSEYYQLQDAAHEPDHATLLHAFNNTLGMHLLTLQDLLAARRELLEQAAECNMDVYLGTDYTTTPPVSSSSSNSSSSSSTTASATTTPATAATRQVGDWPVEVLKHAVYRRCSNVELRSCGFAQNTRNAELILSALWNHQRAGRNMLLELHFPALLEQEGAVTTSSATNTSVAAAATSSSSSSSSASVLPVAATTANVTTAIASLTEGAGGAGGAAPVVVRFVAVRDGHVYDSTLPAPAPLELAHFQHFLCIDKVYKIELSNIGGGNANNSNSAKSDGGKDDL